MALVNKVDIGTVAPMMGLPTNLAAFTISYAEMLKFSTEEMCGPNQRINTYYPRHSFHDVARNEIAQCSAGLWTLMLDSDHTFAPDLLLRLYRSMMETGYDVVSGLYLFRHPPYGPVMWQWEDPESPTNHTAQALVDWPHGERLEVGIAGAGCLLIKNKVFDRIMRELGEDPFSRKEFDGMVGEDFAFFRRLKKLKIKAMVDTRIECHHIQVRGLKVDEDYEPDLELSKMIRTKAAR